MQKRHGKVVFSASDLSNFLECEHLTTLDLLDLEQPLPRAGQDEHAELLQAKGAEHEEAYLERLRQSGVEIVDAGGPSQGLETGLAWTHEAMAEGAPIIYQACLYAEPFIGYADFLRRVEQPSSLGDYSYEIVDTKLARNPKTTFLVQLCLYSDLLAVMQGTPPDAMHLVFGDGTEQGYRVADYSRYYRTVKARFLEHVRGNAAPTYPEPCPHCDLCQWLPLCQARWEADDHLNQVANITRTQIKKLYAAGFHTLAGLARLDPERSIPGIQSATLERLRRQAALQLAKRETGEDRFELVAPDPAGAQGLGRLPAPDPGDLFFDIEGDPYEVGGLEYLLGVYYHEGGEAQFQAFWAHDRGQERESFEAFIAFVMERLARYPGMHIYHYAPYEETALKRLMSLHGTCEAEVDHLLRSERLVDLYKVVREGLRVSEPRYSIKNLETFYMGKRGGEVTEGGASIVAYEHWRATGDPEILEEIRAYNEEDCRSTYLLREWLLTLRPEGAQGAGTHADEAAEGSSDSGDSKVHEVEQRLARYAQQLLGGFPTDRRQWGSEAHFRELVFQLLDFHRRAAKPVWWAMFARQEMGEEELIEDPECLGGLEREPDSQPEPVKQSLLFTYRFPEQEFKLGPGDPAKVAATLEPAGTIAELDEGKRQIRLKRGNSKGELPERLSIIPSGPINTDPLRKALYRFADSLIAGHTAYPALEAFLQREPPHLVGRSRDAPILPGKGELIEEVIAAVARLQGSHLFIQGPPGAGKTFTGSHVIVALLGQGYRVGVSSNSHKAINNLLQAVEGRAAKRGLDLHGVKKASPTNPESCLNGELIQDVSDKRLVIASEAQLIGGTAWLFADPDLDQALDYLFIDEAGQVALANLVAMGTSARNLVLLGDQMQLQQPIQGVHPGHSGDSALDYLLQGRATVPPDEGVFLPTTWRMHETICRFISQAVYDGRLQAELANQNQRLLLGRDAHPALRPTGIRFIEANHEGCSQRSTEEAELVHALYASLLRQRYADRQGAVSTLTREDILVVAPYNMQVNLLEATLPAGARVGTVDKFQGQEAQVVILSLATSSGEELPRYMEFLYSKNRLNVALSRARCLALLVANPALMRIRCRTVEQMGLVNTLCWVSEYAASLEDQPR